MRRAWTVRGDGRAFGTITWPSLRSRAVLFAAALVATIVVPTAATATPADATPGGGPSTPSNEREVVGRTDRSTTVRNPDGSFTTESHAGRVNYRDAQGEWKRIDPMLRANKGRFTNGAGPVAVSFASKPTPSDVLEVSGRGWSVGFGLEGLKSDRRGVAKGGQLTIVDALADSDVTYTVTAVGVKEVVTLKAPPASPGPLRLRFPLRLRGVDVGQEPDGTVVFVRDGATVGHVPVGVASDSSGDRARGDEPARAPVTYRLLNGGQVLEAEVSGEFLATATYPVFVDPAFNAGRDTAGGDAFGRSDFPNNNYNYAYQTSDGRNYLNKIGYNGPEFVSVAKFDVSPAANQTITAATWYGHLYTGGAPHQFHMWRATDNWNENTVTFANRPNHAPDSRSMAGVGGIWVNADVTAWVESWTNPAGTPNYGVVYDMGGQAGYYELMSAEMSVYNQDSFIAVTWQPRAPILTGASDSPDPVAPGGTVSFNVTWSDPYDQVRAVVCKTNFAVNGDCASAGDRWGVGGLSSTGTSTASYATTQADRGSTNTYFAFACDAGGTCSASAQGTFAVTNPAPSITSAGDSPDPVVEGGTVSFSVGWSDPGETNVKTVICKTNAVTGNGSCPSGTWAIGAESATSPAVATYTTNSSDVGTRTYWAFACDRAACSPSISGTFTVTAASGQIARSERSGLEDFYHYRTWDVGGTGTLYLDTASARFNVQYRDLAVPGQGLNLGITRTYSSGRVAAEGPLGKGWTLAVTDAPSSGMGRGPEVTATANLLAFDDADGTTHTFVKDGPVVPAWRSPPGVNLVASDGIDLGGQWWAVTRPDGVRTEFRLVGAFPRVTKITDRKDASLTFAYLAGKINTVTDSTGRTITFTWTNGFVSQIRYQSGSSVYDITYTVTNALLTGVTEAAGTTSTRTTAFTNLPFSYGGTYLGSITDPRGAVTRIGADCMGISAGSCSDALLQWIGDRAGQYWNVFNSTEGSCNTPAPESCLENVTVRDPQGFDDKYQSSNGNVVKHVDRGEINEVGFATNTRSFVWVNNRLRRSVDEAGILTEYDWDDLGQLTESRLSGQQEAPLVTRLTYARPNPAVGDLTDSRAGVGTAEERHTHFDYDTAGKGLVVSATDPLGNQTSYAHYGVRGLLKQITDANAHTTTLGNTLLPDGGYDPSGQPTRVTDPSGAVTQHSYDFLGRRTQTIDRNNKTSARAYDLRGNPTSETDQLSRTTLHCYDLNDNEILTVTPKAPSASCGLDGTDGFSTKRSYDQRDLPAEVLSASDGQRRKSTYSYYSDGELNEILQPRSFDAATGLPSGTVQKATYLRYPNNRVSAMIDEGGNRTDVVYTPDGLPRIVTDPDGGLGRHNVVYDYTKLRQVRTELDLGHSAPTLTQYNAHGDQIAQSTPRGSTTINRYDNAGRLTTTLNALGRVSTRTYDPVGNLTSVSQPAGLGGSITTSYTYTSRDEIASESDPADPLHAIEYAYDPEGRQRFRHDHYGPQLPGPLVDGPVERTTEQRYRDDGKLSERIATFATGAALAHRVTFDYDANGNPTANTTYASGAASPNVSAITATYTSANELKTWNETLYPPSGPGVTKLSSYSYQADGLLASRTVDGLATSYTHTLNGHELTTTPWGAGMGSFTSNYYPNGAIKHVDMPNSATVDHTYDLADRALSKIVRHPNGTVLSSWENIVYDDDDNRTAETASRWDTLGANQSGTGHYIHDRLNRLIASRHPLDTSLNPYVLDDAGNIITEAEAVYIYTANRLTNRAAFPAVYETSVYGYDHFGNRNTESAVTTLLGSPTVTDTHFDAASHTNDIVSSGPSVSYRYDGYDRQVFRYEASSPVTLQFHDGPNGQIAMETDGAGSAKTRYILDSGGEVIANEDAALPPMSGRGYYVCDPRANLTQLLDHNAAGTGPQVVATYGYDSFGTTKTNLTASKTKVGGTGTWDSRLRFQTAPRDPLNGQYALGPRMYDPKTYRFVGADSAVSAQSGIDLQIDPLTGNRYLYAGANPANLIDDGHKPIWKDWKRPRPLRWMNKRAYDPAGWAVGRVATALGGRGRSCGGNARCIEGAPSWMGFTDAFTLGHTVVSKKRLSHSLEVHELAHVRQYERLGVTFLPSYAGSSLACLCYKNNIYEIDAGVAVYADNQRRGAAR